METRAERLLAEAELRKSAWWSELHDRFFALCLTRKRGARAKWFEVWIRYRAFFRGRGYWLDEDEYIRQLRRAGYVIFGSDLRCAGSGHPREAEIADVQLDRTFDLLLTKQPGEWNVAEMRRHSGLSTQMLKTLRESGMGPQPWRTLGAQILYEKAGYRSWLRGGATEELVARFAAVRLRFDPHGLAVVPIRRLRQALDVFLAEAGCIQPAGAHRALKQALVARNCTQGAGRVEYRGSLCRIWRGVDLM
jgi:hypothetical protein